LIDTANDDDLESFILKASQGEVKIVNQFLLC